MSTPLQLSLKNAARLVSEKLRVYLHIFNWMENHDGWMVFPPSILDYWEKLGVTHWAALYFQQGKKNWLKEHEADVAGFQQSIIDELGSHPTPERCIEVVSQHISEFGKAATQDEPPESILSPNLAETNLDEMTPDELRVQRDFWATWLVLFYDDLSLAIHSESIHDLVFQALEHKDSKALFKAIQIDRTLLPHFEKHFARESMKGNGNFFDTFAYRINKAPLRGSNKQALLRILLRDLYMLKCLHRGTTSKQILDLYQSVVGEHPKFAIDDELIVQRHRRDFLKKYRQKK